MNKDYQTFFKFSQSYIEKIIIKEDKIIIYHPHNANPTIYQNTKENKDKLKTVLYNLIESIRIGAILLLPFIPDTANEILRQINTKNITLDTITFGSLETDIHINDFKPIFMRVEKDEK